jgi:NAD(P)-dependent dehydrogenase (short-subunit alcohol dehydrogenase family)
MNAPNTRAVSAPLAGRVVIVTGGNGGIGLGLARGVARAGAAVAIWGRNEAKNKKALAELERDGAVVVALQCDISSESAVARAFAETVSSLGHVDCIFANAGVPGNMIPFTELTTADWRDVLATNLDGTFFCLREAAKYMMGRGVGGSLVGVSSITSFYGAAHKQPYGVAKAGIEALMRSLAVELAPHNIRSNSLLPGWTDTELLVGGAGFIDEKNYDVVRKYTTRRTPVARWGQAADFESVAVFLADPATTFHTGDRLVVDGGYTIF